MEKSSGCVINTTFKSSPRKISQSKTHKRNKKKNNTADKDLYQNDEEKWYENGKAKYEFVFLNKLSYHNQ